MNRAIRILICVLLSPIFLLTILVDLVWLAISIFSIFDGTGGSIDDSDLFPMTRRLIRVVLKRKDDGNVTESRMYQTFWALVPPIVAIVLALITSIAGCVIPPLAPLVALGFIPIWIGWAMFIYFVKGGEGPFD